MATLSKGKTFTSGETVEPADMHELVDLATVTFSSADDTDNSTLEVSGNKFRVKDGGVTLAKLFSAVQNALVPVGSVQAFARSTAPSGWLAANGSTIGSASSNATNASADYSALFGVLWDNWTNTNLPILDSAGAASTRGASASADFAANKRLPLPDLRGYFVRGWGVAGQNGANGDGTVSGAFGSKQGDDNKAHTHSGTTGNDSPDHTHNYTGHSTTLDTVNAAGGQTGILRNTTTRTTGGASARHTHTFTTNSNGSEARPKNIAMLYCIKF